MKLRLATVEMGEGSRKGRLCLVGEDGSISAELPDPFRTIEQVLEHWPKFCDFVDSSVDTCAWPKLENATRPRFLAPLPSACQALYGCAYGNQDKRVFQRLSSDVTQVNRILIYQGSSDYFLPTEASFELAGEVDWGLDFEPELFVVVDHVPMGTRPLDILPFIRLVGVCNDFTYRGLIREERVTGFGFVAGKPLSSMAPYVVTPEFLGRAWNNGRPNLHMKVLLNSETIASHDSNEMEFCFSDLVAHAARTRSLSAGTIVTSGTVSTTTSPNSFGSLIELRAHQAALDLPLSPYLRNRDVVEINFYDENGMSVFGSLKNKISLTK